MGAESAGISVTLASDLQLCPYAHTPPQRFLLYRPFSIPWHLSLHLLDRVFSHSRNFDIMVLSDLAKGGLESGECIYQNKDKKKHYEKYVSVTFPCSVTKQKICDSPLWYCCHLGRHLKYFKTQKTTTMCQSNYPNTITVENYRKILINCYHFEFHFKMVAILDTILNT